MRRGPRGIRAGIAVGCGLLAVSAVLQPLAGPVNWRLTAWPVNIVILAVIVLVTVVMHLLRKRVGFFAWLSSTTNAVCSMSFAVIVTVTLGLTAQSPATVSNDSWYSRLLSSWPFVIIYLWLAISLGLTILRVGSRRWSWRTAAFMLNHLGLLTVLVAATLGNADMRRLTMIVGKETMGYGRQSVAYDELSPMRDPAELDFALALKDFEIEYYEPDSQTDENGLRQPKSFTSYVRVYTMEDGGAGLWTDTIIQVNRPLTVNGWKIYQYGYDNATDESPRYSRFQLVRDPWQPLVYCGILMMLGGALTLLFTSTPKTAKP